jgi:serine/threonine protein kinase
MNEVYVNNCLKRLDQNKHILLNEDILINKNMDLVIFTFKFCNMKTVKELLNSSFSLLDEDIIFSLLYQMIKAVKYLHSYNIAHRDLKNENFLIDNGNVILCDFATAYVKSYHNPIQKEYFSSLESLTYEMLSTDKEEDPFTYDIWCLGHSIYELIFKETCLNATQLKIQPEGTLMDLVYQCLQKNRKDRPSIEEIYNHPWITTKKNEFNKNKKKKSHLIKQTFEKYNLKFLDLDDSAEYQRMKNRNSF